MSFMTAIRRQEAPRSRAAIHPSHCRCATCLPRRRSEFAQVANRLATLTVAGLALGLFLAWIVDALVGGPGILFMFTGAN